MKHIKYGNISYGMHTLQYKLLRNTKTKTIYLLLGSKELFTINELIKRYKKELKEEILHTNTEERYGYYIGRLESLKKEYCK